MHMRQLVFKLFKKMFVILNGWIYFLCRFFPVKKFRILMESEGDFSDNVRVFYDWLLRKGYNDKLEIIWIVHDPKKYKNEINVKFISRFKAGLNIRAYYYAATSKFLIFSHPYWLRTWRKNQYVINTTHSVAQLKAENPIKRKQADYVLCCSEYCKAIKEKLFIVDEKNILILGIPRIDLMFEHIECLPLLFAGNEVRYTGKKFILSMETFKQNSNMMDSDNTEGYAINVIHTEKDIIKLDVFLEEMHCIMIVKIHHLQDLSFLKSISLRNIIYLTDDVLCDIGIQVNQLLENADILLTDYSSVFYDFLLKDRPIGFTIGDIAEYKRGFIMENPLEEMPGEKLKNFEELKAFIRDSLIGIDNYREARKRLREKVFKYQDSNNCERFYKWICSQRKEIT